MTYMHVTHKSARMKAGKIADFLGELSALIFQDMRENAAEKLQNSSLRLTLT